MDAKEARRRRSVSPGLCRWGTLLSFAEIPHSTHVQKWPQPNATSSGRSWHTTHSFVDVVGDGRAARVFAHEFVRQSRGLSGEGRERLIRHRGEVAGRRRGHEPRALLEGVEFRA